MPQGSYTEMLGRLAANEALLRIYRSSSPHLRMRDRELILRFFALVRASPSGLRSPVKARPSPTPPLTHVILCPPALPLRRGSTRRFASSGTCRPKR